MMLRIETGKYKGKIINTVPDSRTRYTSAVIRRALSSMIDFNGKICADICCGSGIVGFEMLSNGAGSVTFVDASAKAISTVKANAKLLGVESIVNFYRSDVRNFLENCGRKFDLVFSDPPYDLGIVKDIVQRVHHIMNNDSIFVLQCSKREKPKEEDIKLLKVIKTKEYGDSLLYFFEKN
ncbi:MAG: RsmD family RNA methyltransferase [Fervidobacterium sp.]